MKRTTRLLVAVMAICLILTPSRVLADTGYDDSVATIMTVDTGDSYCTLASSGGVLMASAFVKGHNSDTVKCELTVKLQVKNGLTWQTVTTWKTSQNARRAALSKSYTGESGKTYRAVATMTVWSNSSSETKTITSGTVRA